MSLKQAIWKRAGQAAGRVKKDSSFKDLGGSGWSEKTFKKKICPILSLSKITFHEDNTIWMTQLCQYFAISHNTMKI